MPLVTALGVVLLIVVVAAAVATRDVAPLDDDRAIPAKSRPAPWKPSLSATDIPNMNAGTFIAILVALPVLLHIYSIVQAVFGDPQSPLYVLLRWLANL